DRLAPAVVAGQFPQRLDLRRHFFAFLNEHPCSPGSFSLVAVGRGPPCLSRPRLALPCRALPRPARPSRTAPCRSVAICSLTPLKFRREHPIRPGGFRRSEER